MKYREDEELIAFFDYVRTKEKSDTRYKAIFHVANERRTSPMQGARLKRKGVKAGIPDVIVPIPNGHNIGLVMEFKVKPNKLTPKQADTLRLFSALGWATALVYTAEFGIKFLEEYLRGAK